MSSRFRRSKSFNSWVQDLFLPKQPQSPGWDYSLPEHLIQSNLIQSNSKETIVMADANLPYLEGDILYTAHGCLNFSTGDFHDITYEAAGLPDLRQISRILNVLRSHPRIVDQVYLRLVKGDASAQESPKVSLQVLDRFNPENVYLVVDTHVLVSEFIRGGAEQVQRLLLDKIRT